MTLRTQKSPPAPRLTQGSLFGPALTNQHRRHVGGAGDGGARARGVVSRGVWLLWHTCGGLCVCARGVRACVGVWRGRASALPLTRSCSRSLCAVMAKTPAKKAAKEGKKKSGHKKAKKESYGIYIYKVRAGGTRARAQRVAHTLPQGLTRRILARAARRC